MILKKNDKCPAIIFQKNTIACINIVKNLSNYIDIIEEKKYPELRNKRCKDIPKTKQLIKKLYKPAGISPAKILCLPVMPSKTISNTSTLIMTKPTYNTKCITATSGFLNIFFCPNASSTRFLKRADGLSLKSSSLPNNILRRIWAAFL